MTLTIHSAHGRESSPIVSRDQTRIAQTQGWHRNMPHDYETMMCLFEIEARARNLRAQWVEQFRISVARRIRSWTAADEPLEFDA